MSDSEFNADYVEAFNNAQDDEQALADSERHATTNTGGCLSTATIVLAVVIVLAFFLK